MAQVALDRACSGEAETEEKQDLRVFSALTQRFGRELHSNGVLSQEHYLHAFQHWKSSGLAA